MTVGEDILEVDLSVAVDCAIGDECRGVPAHLLQLHRLPLVRRDVRLFGILGAARICAIARIGVAATRFFINESDAVPDRLKNSPIVPGHIVSPNVAGLLWSQPAGATNFTGGAATTFEAMRP